MTWRRGNREPFKKILKSVDVFVRDVVLASPEQ
jgi:hypothetical protein